MFQKTVRIFAACKPVPAKSRVIKASDISNLYIVLVNFSRYNAQKAMEGENVTTDVLLHICSALGCSIGDIMDAVEKR